MARRSSAKNEMQDSSLPEKQRARRRFIGASILALGAMILLPLALESEPRQSLGTIDVSIPKREDLGRRAQYWPDTAYRQTVATTTRNDQPGLFTRDEDAAEAFDDNRFNPGGGQPAAPAPSTGAAELPDRTVKNVNTDKTVKSGQSDKTESNGSANRAADTKPVSPEPKKLAAIKPPAPEIKAPPMPERRTDRNQIDAASPSGYVVQIGAFSSVKGANAQVRRAKSLGFTAYTERIKTAKGVRIRVRVGPYLNRGLADDARQRLRKQGIETALIAP